jgi:hypothetical protein
METVSSGELEGGVGDAALRRVAVQIEFGPQRQMGGVCGVLLT